MLIAALNWEAAGVIVALLIAILSTAYMLWRNHGAECAAEGSQDETLRHLVAEVSGMKNQLGRLTDAVTDMKAIQQRQADQQDQIRGIFERILSLERETLCREEWERLCAERCNRIKELIDKES